jgi:hydrogenase small subunit
MPIAASVLPNLPGTSSRMSSRDDRPYRQLIRRGMSRRTFLQFSAAMTTALALPVSYAPRIAAAVAAAPRVPLIWLHGQACGGDTRAFLQAPEPTTVELFLDLLSIDYDQALMAGSGSSAEDARDRLRAAAPNGYLAVVEGAIPTDDDGVYCTTGGRTFSDIAREVCAGAIATITVGTCAFDGGVPKAAGGTTGATGVRNVVAGVPVVNLPGCPLNVVNLTATVVHYLTFKTLPATDAQGRPLFAYGGLLHNQCERRAHFEFGEFVQDWGDEGAQKGWCLYKMGCKGPENYANCPTARYADESSWPVRAGHGCIGCTSAGFWDSMGPAYDRLPGPVPFASQVTVDQVGMVLVGGVAALTVAHGAASSVRLKRWGNEARRERAAAAVPAAAVAAASAVPAAAVLSEPEMIEPGVTVEPEITEPQVVEPANIEVEASAPEAMASGHDGAASEPETRTAEPEAAEPEAIKPEAAEPPEATR